MSAYLVLDVSTESGSRYTLDNEGTLHVHRQGDHYLGASDVYKDVTWVMIQNGTSGEIRIVFAIPFALDGRILEMTTSAVKHMSTEPVKLSRHLVGAI